MARLARLPNAVMVTRDDPDGRYTEEPDAFVNVGAAREIRREGSTVVVGLPGLVTYRFQMPSEVDAIAGLTTLAQIAAR